MSKQEKQCVEAKGKCTHVPDTCPISTKGKDCPYFKKG